MTIMAIMDVIRAECERRGWGPQELAAAMGIASSPCYRWLVPGRSRVQDSSIDKMLAALDLDPGDMLCGLILVERLRLIQSMAGNPDPHEACRLIIAEVQAVLDKVA